VKQASDFLFKKPDEKDGEPKWLDTRTDIHNREMFNTLTYYRLLEEQYNCKAAGAIADVIERLLMSSSRQSRLEAVTILEQKMPKEETIVRGLSETLQKLKGLEE
jgi:hypothetical protein